MQVCIDGHDSVALYFILCVLGIELRALHMLCQHLATDLCLQPWKLFNNCKGFESEAGFRRQDYQATLLMLGGLVSMFTRRWRRF